MQRVAVNKKEKYKTKNRVHKAPGGRLASFFCYFFLAVATAIINTTK
jgi:hypothetical protein